MRRTIHFSVDDMIEAFEWLCQNERTVTSIFEAGLSHQ